MGDGGHLAAAEEYERSASRSGPPGDHSKYTVGRRPVSRCIASEITAIALATDTARTASTCSPANSRPRTSSGSANMLGSRSSISSSTTGSESGMLWRERILRSFARTSATLSCGAASTSSSWPVGDEKSALP